MTQILLRRKIQKDHSRVATQEFIEEENYIKRPGRTIGCKQTKSGSQIHRAVPWAIRTKDNLPGTPPDQNKDRSVITLCNDLLDQRLFTYLDATNSQTPTKRPSFEAIDLILTHVIVHELMRGPTFNNQNPVNSHTDPTWEGADEGQRPKLSGYSWNGVQLLDPSVLGNLRSTRTLDNFTHPVGMSRFWDDQYRASPQPLDLLRGTSVKDESQPVSLYPLAPAKSRLARPMKL